MENLAEGSPLANTLKKVEKSTEVNPDVEGYTKARNHRKTIRKMQKGNNLLNTKRIPKYNLGGVRFLHLACQGGGSHPCPRKLRQ